MAYIDESLRTTKTNFCRQMLKQFNDGYTFEQHHEDIEYLAKNSIKFTLPINGLLLNAGFKTLDFNDLHLPFEMIALEFFTSDGYKQIVFCHNYQDGICVVSALKHRNMPWGISPIIIKISNGNYSVKTLYETAIDSKTKNEESVSDEIKNQESAQLMYVLFEFLEALNCKNVSIENHVQRKKGKSKFDALPFDEYKVLCVNVNKRYNDYGDELNESGTHRSPREHLRRGHIRRLPKGNVWVQSTVVNPGIGGRIEKSYQVAA